MQASDALKAGWKVFWAAFRLIVTGKGKEPVIFEMFEEYDA